MEISNLWPSCQLAHKGCVLSFWIRVPYTQLRRHKRMNGRRHKSTPAARFHPHSPLVRHERRGGKKRQQKAESWWNRGGHRFSAVSLIREVKCLWKTEGTKEVEGLLSDGKGGGHGASVTGFGALYPAPGMHRSSQSKLRFIYSGRAGINTQTCLATKWRTVTIQRNAWLEVEILSPLNFFFKIILKACP